MNVKTDKTWLKMLRNLARLERVLGKGERAVNLKQVHSIVSEKRGARYSSRNVRNLIFATTSNHYFSLKIGIKLL